MIWSIPIQKFLSGALFEFDDLIMTYWEGIKRSLIVSKMTSAVLWYADALWFLYEENSVDETDTSLDLENIYMFFSFWFWISLWC